MATMPCAGPPQTMRCGASTSSTVEVMSSPAVCQRETEPGASGVDVEPRGLPAEDRAGRERAVCLGAVDVRLPGRPGVDVGLDVPDRLDGRGDPDLVAGDHRRVRVDVHRVVLSSGDGCSAAACAWKLPPTGADRKHVNSNPRPPGCVQFQQPGALLVSGGCASTPGPAGGAEHGASYAVAGVRFLPA